ncbi:MAG: DUF389 domain-containing protein [Pseudonocardia sp.]|nr:DUF389 domain-containing protein [Pseudonocardia sp.]
MIHLRVVSPSDLTERTLALLIGDPGVLNLVVLPGRARNPDGDAIECDVLGGTANTVLASLRRLQLDRRGSVVVEPVEFAVSRRAADVEAGPLGALRDAPVWEAVEARIRADGRYPPSFYLFLITAGIIGAVGILTNSQILIVAAMVLGPEYGAITSVALGLDRHSGKAVRDGLSALALGFLLAIAAAFAFALLVRVLGLEPTAFRLGIRPVTALIDTPNVYSLVVAVLAGIVGIVSLTHARTSTLLGVFISVTTIPAASAIGVASAFGSWSETRGSVFQLLLNIVVLIVVGLMTLRFVRLLWRRVGERRGR